MKKIFKTAIMFVAASLAFVGCDKEETFDTELGKTIILNGSASTPSQEGTRVSIGEKSGDQYPVSWSEGDALAIYQLAGSSYTSKSNIELTVDSGDASHATFSFEAADAAEEFYAFYPSAKAVSVTANNGACFTLDASQTPTADFASTDAALMFATTDASGIQDGNISFEFEHMVAYAKMTVKGPSAASGKVESISFETDTDIAGRFYYKWNEEEYTTRDGQKSVVINVADLNYDANSTFTVWFALRPGTLNTFNVTVNTADASYTKECLGELKFQKGHIAAFTVDMSNISADDPGVVYTQVTSLEDITAGMYILIMEDKDHAGSYYTLSNANATAGKVLMTGAAAAKITVNKDSQTINVKEDGYNWIFAGNYEGTTIKSALEDGGYLYCIANNNGVQVGKESSNKWVFEKVDDAETFRLKMTYQNSKSEEETRYLSSYINGNNWRGYANPTTSQSDFYLFKNDSYVAPEPEEPEEPELPQGGTEDSPFTVAEAIAAAQQIGKDGAGPYYVQGKISKITEQYGSYGNATFDLIDEGQPNATFTAYRVKYLENVAWQSSQDNIHVGDEVVICGKIVNYGGTTPEISTDGYLYKFVSYAPTIETFEVNYDESSSQVTFTATYTNKSSVALNTGFKYSSATTQEVNVTAEGDGSKFTATISTSDLAYGTYNVTAYVNDITSSTKSFTHKDPNAGEAQQYVDVLNFTWTGVKSGASYDNWTKQGSASEAVYAGRSAGDQETIQLRSTNSDCGIVSTTSGGTVKKIVVTWDTTKPHGSGSNATTGTTTGRTLNVYGKNTAYESATDLYNDTNKGTLIGTIVCGTSTELEIQGAYTFIGLRSNNGAMYIDEIQITWEK